MQLKTYFFVPLVRPCMHHSYHNGGVGRFRSCLYKWGMASSAACECGAEQTVDHVVLHCPMHRPPPRTTRLDGSGRWDNRMAVQHLPRYLGGLAVDKRTRSNERPQWWNFRKSYTQRFRVAYNFGCRALNNLPWRVLVVMTHQVQYNILTFEAVLRKNMHLFLERRRRSNNVMVAWFDAVRLFIIFLILWTLQPHFALGRSARTLQCLFVWGCACHNAFVLCLGLTSLGISVPLCSSVVPSEQIVLRMRL